MSGATQLTLTRPRKVFKSTIVVARPDGPEVGRITKTWEGLARTAFSTADHYVVQIHKELPEPLRSLVVASSLCVDTALKQDKRGFN